MLNVHLVILKSSACCLTSMLHVIVLIGKQDKWHWISPSINAKILIQIRHWILTLAAANICRTDFAISTPMPSPGISVTRCRCSSSTTRAVESDRCNVDSRFNSDYACSLFNTTRNTHAESLCFVMLIMGVRDKTNTWLLWCEMVHWVIGVLEYQVSYAITRIGDNARR